MKPVSHSFKFRNAKIVFLIKFAFPIVLKTSNMANDKEFSIELKQEIAKGSYSNLAIITHSHSEFIIDFATMLPGLPKPEVGNRIIMTPEHAKRLFLALQDNINKYESQHGQITIGGEPKATFPMGGFGGGAKS